MTYVVGRLRRRTGSIVIRIWTKTPRLSTWGSKLQQCGLLRPCGDTKKTCAKTARKPSTTDLGRKIVRRSAACWRCQRCRSIIKPTASRVSVVCRCPTPTPRPNCALTHVSAQLELDIKPILLSSIQISDPKWGGNGKELYSLRNAQGGRHGESALWLLSLIHSVFHLEGAVGPLGGCPNLLQVASQAELAKQTLPPHGTV